MALLQANCGARLSPHWTRSGVNGGRRVMIIGLNDPSLDCGKLSGTLSAGH